MELKELEAEKKAAIEYNGNALVVANPGTGKTTTIACKYLHLVSNGINPERILCITFTEKAKNEMLEDIVSIAEKNSISISIADINVQTFHSFCYNYLKENATDVPTEIAEETELKHRIYSFLKEQRAFFYTQSYIIGTIVPAIASNIRFLKSYGILPQDIELKKTFEILKQESKKSGFKFSIEEMEAVLKIFAESYKDYESWKDKKFIDYNDLLIEFPKRFKEQHAYDHVLVDELQDVNKIEAEIALQAGKTIFAVGDKKQSIFGFQGGAYSNFEKFSEKNGFKHFNLTKNRRNTKQILDYGKKFFETNSKNPEHFSHELQMLQSAENKNGPIPQIIICEDAEDFAVKKVFELLKSNEDEKTIGIIARTNSQAISISKKLDSLQIGHSCFSESSSSERAKKEIIHFIEGILSNEREKKIKALFTPFSIISLKEAFAVSRDRNAEVEKYFSEFEGSLEKINLLFKKRILPISASFGEDYFKTAVLMQKKVENYILNNESPGLEGLMEYLSIISEPLGENPGKEKVNLLTVHKAKGLEFDFVIYLPYSTREMTREYRLIAECILLEKGINAREEIEDENIRIDFVAITRAREALFIAVEDEKAKKRYAIGDYCSVFNDGEKTGWQSPEFLRYNDAYKKFTNFEFEEAKKLLSEKHDNWIEKITKLHFNEIKHFSYSSVQRMNKSPFDYFIESVAKIKSSSREMAFGSAMHELFRKHFENEQCIFSDEEEKTIFENMLKCMKECGEKFGKLKPTYAEHEITLEAGKIFGKNENLAFTAKIDLIAEHEKGYLVIDFKTDKEISNDPGHFKQLEVYRKMLSIEKNIPLEKIWCAVFYVNLRGKINLGKIGHAVSISSNDKKYFNDFQEWLENSVDYRKNPDAFLERAFEKMPNFDFSNGTEFLFNSLKEAWKKGKELI